METKPFKTRCFRLAGIKAKYFEHIKRHNTIIKITMKRKDKQTKRKQKYKWGYIIKR